MKASEILSFVAGAAAAAGITLLFTTDKGKDLREKVASRMTKEEIDKLAAEKGFRDNWQGQGVNYISDRIALEDMHPANVFIDEVTSLPVCIDCIVKFVK